MLGRDRFGVKPLYYFLNAKNMIFASEMKAITPFLKSIEPSNNIDFQTKFLFYYEATDECVIKGIKRLEPGHFLTFENNNI